MLVVLILSLTILTDIVTSRVRVWVTSLKTAAGSERWTQSSDETDSDNFKQRRLLKKLSVPFIFYSNTHTQTHTYIYITNVKLCCFKIKIPAFYQKAPKCLNISVTSKPLYIILA